MSDYDIETQNELMKKHIRGAINVLKTKGWTQKFFARNYLNEPVLVMDDSAVCFCASGAIKRHMGLNETQNDSRNPTYKLYTKIVAILCKMNPIVNYGAISTWNDAEHRTKGEVIELLEKAIATI